VTVKIGEEIRDSSNLMDTMVFPSLTRGLLPEREFRNYKSVFKWDNATDGKNGSTTGSWMVCFYHLFMSGVSYFFVGLVVLIEKEDREKDHSISV
jgi:hypothetical protein